MIVEVVCMPRCLFSYTCGKEVIGVVKFSDLDRLVNTFGNVCMDIFIVQEYAVNWQLYENTPCLVMWSNTNVMWRVVQQAIFYQE